MCLNERERETNTIGLENDGLVDEAKLPWFHRRPRHHPAWPSEGEEIQQAENATRGGMARRNPESTATAEQWWRD